MKHFLAKIYKKLNLSKNLQVSIQRILNDQFLIGVTGVIFNEKHEVLLFKHSYRQVSWSLPGGFLKSGEHPKAGLQREIKEESDLDVVILKIINTNEDEKNARLNINYYGIFKSGKFIPSAEVKEYKFFSVKKLPKLIDDQYKQIEEGYKRFSETHKRSFFSFFKRKLQS